MGRFLGKYSFSRSCVMSMWQYKNQILEQSVCGLDFRNPTGLAAGFDYNADLVDILPSIGFGSHTIGTLTLEPYSGNIPPMLGRLPKSKALLVNKGFKNEGIKRVLSHLSKANGEAIRGVSIGATNKSYDTYEQMADNVISGFKQANGYTDFNFFELNISCPNLNNIKNLPEQISSPSGLRKVLDGLLALSLSRPVFIKMPLERTEEQTKDLLDVAKQFPFIRGLIFSNLLKDRTDPAFDQEEISKATNGNFSGKPLEKKSNKLILFSYRNYGDRFIIVGVGGVFDADDAYRKIRSGATLVQLVTGMIYRGPQVIGEINQGLASLLARDGFNNINEAIGADAKS